MNLVKCVKSLNTLSETRKAKNVVKFTFKAGPKILIPSLNFAMLQSWKKYLR